MTTQTRKAILEDLQELLPIRQTYKTEWAVNFADSLDGSDSSKSIVMILPRRSTVTAIVFNCRRDILQALSVRVDELRNSGRPVLPNRLDDRIVVDGCGPNDVSSLVEVVARIEGRKLAEIDSPKFAPTAPKLVIAYIGEQSPAC